MTTKKLLASQVKSLLLSLSDHGSRHLTEVETDLIQMTFLLGEAIEKLGASFLAIHETVCIQQKTVDSLLAGEIVTVTPEIAENLKNIQSQISQHVNSAVTGLQFQDMTSQLIGRTVKRVVGLREVLKVLEESSGTIPESNTDEIVSLLTNMNVVFEDQSVKLESKLWKAVCQTHMESGDIELF